MCETHTHKKISNFTTAVRTFTWSHPRLVQFDWKFFLKKIHSNCCHLLTACRIVLFCGGKLLSRYADEPWPFNESPRTHLDARAVEFFFFNKINFKLNSIKSNVFKVFVLHLSALRGRPPCSDTASISRTQKKIALIDPNGGAHLHKIWIIRRRLAAFGGDAEQQQHAVCGPRATTGRRPLVGLSSSPCVSVCECVSV